MKRFEISRDHWLALRQAIQESLAAIFPSGSRMLMERIDIAESAGDVLVVVVDPLWFEDAKAALAAHPEPEVGEYYQRDIDTLLEMAEDVPVVPVVKPEAGQSLVELSLGMVLVALAFLILAVLFGPAVTRVMSAQAVAAPPVVDLPPGIEIPEKLGDLPLSEHAKTAHAGEKYNVQTLVPMWDQDLCRRKLIYFCPKTAEFKFFCEVEPAADGRERWGGIILGYKNQTPLKVVSAYPEDWRYWVRRIFSDGCFLVGMP